MIFPSRPAIFFVLGWLSVGLLLISVFSDSSSSKNPTKTVKRHWAESEIHNCSVVDVVYTWVNGSDPDHIKMRKAFLKRDTASRAFRDYGTLQFSMRSIEEFAPWIRNIFLVTNGQIPTWLNVSSPRIRLVTHKEIFTNHSHLPTFNSNAIEAHLYNIPDLADCFIYLNDDFFLTRYLPIDHYVDTKTGSVKLYMDGFLAPEVEQMKTNIWHRSVGYSNDLINKYYHPDASEVVRHNYAGHHCYFFNKHILRTMYMRWQDEFEHTSSHRFRREDDTAVPFMHANVALEEFGAQKSYGLHFGGLWTSNNEDNVKIWRQLMYFHPNCACLQDGLDDSEESAKAVDTLRVLFCGFLRNPSSVELQVPSADPCRHGVYYRTDINHPTP